jgi:hypothetical protein
MIQNRNAAQEIKRRIKRAGGIIGSLNFLTLLVPSGKNNMVIFLEAKLFSPQNLNIYKGDNSN